MQQPKLSCQAVPAECCDTLRYRVHILSIVCGAVGRQLLGLLVFPWRFWKVLVAGVLAPRRCGGITLILVLVGTQLAFASLSSLLCPGRPPLLASFSTLRSFLWQFR